MVPTPRLALAFATTVFTLLLAGSAVAVPAGSTALVSRPDGLGPVAPAFDGFSRGAGAVSDDGRYVAFTSPADGFASGADTTVENLFLRDTRDGTTSLVSRADGDDGAGFNEDSFNASIAVAADGHVLVAFDSRATNGVDHATGPVNPAPGGESLVWLRDVTAGTTTLVSRAGVAGPPANRFAANPSIAITPGGPVVAFVSAATNLGPATGGLMLRTLSAGTNALVACRNNNCATNPTGAQAEIGDLAVVDPAPGTLCAPPAHTTGKCILIAFDSPDTTVTGAPNAVFQTVVGVATAPAAPGAAAGVAGEFVVASRRPDGTLGNSASFRPRLSADGRAVGFVGTATNLTADTVPADTRQGYLKRLDTGAIELVTKATAPGDQDSFSLDVGGVAGRLRVAFESLATNLGGSGPQTYLRNIEQGRTEIVSRAAGAGGAAGDGPSQGQPSVSADGSSVVFSSNAKNLISGAGNFQRVYVRRIAAPEQTVELVSRPSGTGPLPAGTLNAFLAGPGSVSADGRFVTFGSESSTLSGAPDGDRVDNVFVRDLVTARTTLVSRAPGADGVIADASSFPAGISDDGRRVVFSSGATNLGSDVPRDVTQVYVRDLETGTNTLVSRADGANGAPVAGQAFGADISANGRVVAFLTKAPLDPAADDGQFHVYLRDLDAGTTTLVDRDSGARGTVPAVSSGVTALDADGDHVTWVSEAAIAGAPADGNLHVFVRDVRTLETSLVSRVDGAGGAPANSDSFDATISADGDTIAFSSEAPNLGVPDRGTRVFAREVGAGRTTLVSVGTSGDGAALVQAEGPSIDASGRVISFSGTASEDSRQKREVYLRDLGSPSSEIVSRADGPEGAPRTGEFAHSAISANGQCVAFGGDFTGLGDGFDSTDFESVHLRAVRGDCPVAPPGPARVPDPPGDGGSEAGDPKHPSLFRLSLRPSRFHVGGKGGGTVIRYTLSNDASVTVRFDRLVTGHRKGRACSTKVRRGKRCTIVRRAGSLELRGRAGSNKRAFSGKIGRKALAPGRYRVTAKPKSGRGAKVTVVVVKAPKKKRR